MFMDSAKIAWQYQILISGAYSEKYMNTLSILKKTLIIMHIQRQNLVLLYSQTAES